MKLYYYDSHEENTDKELDIEFISNNARFGMWFDDKEAGWFYVHKESFEDEKTIDDLCGNLNKELLELMYNRIGKILGK